MIFYVRDIELDFTDSQGELSKDEQNDILLDLIGGWEADDDDDLIEELTTACGFCVKSIDYVRVPNEIF